MTHGHQHQHDHAPAADDWADFAELLDLDADVLHDHLREVTGWVRQLAGPSRRVLDLGAGTGRAALAFAQLFPGSEIVAADVSAGLLQLIRSRAVDLGVADRVRTVETDLDDGWPPVGPVDVAWASNSMHHVADPDGLLGEAFAAITPGGLLAVSEMVELPRFLPHDLGIGRPGLEERCHEVIAADHAHAVPDLGSDWGPRLEAAGFGPVTDRTFTLAAGDGPLLGRYARAYLLRVRPRLSEHMTSEDLDALDALLEVDGPQSLLQRQDLAVRGERIVWIARRP